ncbi:hypothetical protein B0H13DRAFT_2276962, partial [Mycena leptocephala]
MARRRGIEIRWGMCCAGMKYECKSKDSVRAIIWCSDGLKSLVAAWTARRPMHRTRRDRGKGGVDERFIHPFHTVSFEMLDSKRPKILSLIITGRASFKTTINLTAGLRAHQEIMESWSTSDSINCRVIAASVPMNVNPKSLSVILLSIPSYKPEILLNIRVMVYARIEDEEPYEEPRGAGYSPNPLIRGFVFVPDARKHQNSTSEPENIRSRPHTVSKKMEYTRRVVDASDTREIVSTVVPDPHEVCPTLWNTNDNLNFFRDICDTACDTCSSVKKIEHNSPLSYYYLIVLEMSGRKNFNSPFPSAPGSDLQRHKPLSCHGLRDRYAIGPEPYTGVLNIRSFIPRPFSRFYPMTSDCSGGHCPKSPNFSRADSQIFWRGCQQLGMELGIQQNTHSSRDPNFEVSRRSQACILPISIPHIYTITVLNGEY